MDRSDRLGTFALIGLCLVTSLLYLPFIDHPFQYDDEHTIVANTALEHPDAWKTAFTGAMPSSSEVLSRHYRPLTYLTYWITFRLVGPSPTAFHAVNLALHLFTVGLVLALLRTLIPDRRIAMLTAALFALHPATSEAVLYASARATLLSSLFMLAALVCYAQGRRRQAAGRSSAGWWVGWAAAGLAAFLAKETSVVLPLLCLATDHVVVDRNTPITGWSRWGPSVAAGAVLTVLLIGMGPWQHAAAALTAPDAVSRYLVIVATQIGAIGMAIRLFVLPWPLSVDHPLAPWPDPSAVLLTGLVGAWCALAVFALASRVPAARWAGFFALWVIIVALPTTVWPLNVPFQEHRAYLQHAGLSTLIALGVTTLLDTRRIGRTAAVLVGGAALIGSAWLIREQGRRWSDPVQLWDHARLTAPTSFRSHTNAGLALASAGHWDEAAAALTTALRLNPDYPTALVARGVIAHRRGERAAAAADYERAAQLRPGYVPALFNRGLLAQEMNDLASAEQWYRRVLTINPLHANTLLNLGVILLTQERIAEADAVFAAGRTASPRSPALLYYSGVVAERQTRAGDAATYYRDARRTALAGGRQGLADDAQARLRRLGVE